MKTKISCIALIILILLTVIVAADDTSITVCLNDIPVIFDVDPIIENDKTLVPMRAIFEMLGAEITWDGETRSVVGVKSGIIIIMQIDNPVASINGEELILDVPPRIINDTTLVPLRVVAEGLSAKVDWDAMTRTVYISAESNIELSDADLEYLLEIQSVFEDLTSFSYSGEEDLEAFVGWFTEWTAILQRIKDLNAESEHIKPIQNALLEACSSLETIVVLAEKALAENDDSFLVLEPEEMNRFYENFEKASMLIELLESSSVSRG